MIYRLIAPEWALKDGKLKKVLEGEFQETELAKFNSQGYNVYYLPNYPREYEPNTIVSGSHINVFNFVFIDFDLKSKTYPSKDVFLDFLISQSITPTKIVDSGHGIHAYWKVENLDAMSYLRFQRRLMRQFRTDGAIGQIFQLMRAPGYLNTKIFEKQVKCELLSDIDLSYTCEELDKLLPPITVEDEEYCQQHYNITYGLNQDLTSISEEIPSKFGQLIRENSEVKELWTDPTDDRSKNDFRLGHIMYANNFTKEEAASVLVNSRKALQRASVHRASYAMNIINKIWTFEQDPIKEKTGLSRNVADILQKSDDNALVGDRLVSWKYVDDTEMGFRLGHVLGLVAGSGVGKTTMALNMFLGFVQSNPDYHHFFVPLEQPDREIALRWKIMCGANTHLHDKVHIINNYDENGTFRDLSLLEIKNHILEFQALTNNKVGCVVIDHIGILCNNNKHGQDEGVKEIAKAMKGFAIETKTFLIMQSQTARSKASIGDIELDKDAAFGTSVFENFCDYLVTMWQPLKRVYDMGAPTILSYKFCKIRHKKQGVDVIKEDKPYSVYFDPETQIIKELTESQEKSLTYWVGQATAKRKADKKTDIVSYTSIKWETNES